MRFESANTSMSISEIIQHRYYGDTYVVPNVYFFNWESDVLVYRKSGYTLEFEIKVSRSDFKADFKKSQKHHALRTGLWPHIHSAYFCELFSPYGEGDRQNRWWRKESETSRCADGSNKWTEYIKKRRPNKFYYCCPDGLLKPEEIPEYAGLIYFDENTGSYNRIKEAPFLHKEKMDIKTVNHLLCNKFYWYWRNLKRTIK